MAEFDQEIPDEKVEAAVFGEEVRIFLEEDRIGRYILAKAAEAVEAGLVELKDVDPDHPKTIRNIQFKIRVAESVVEWLVGAVDSGNNARLVLQDEEDNKR